jgi:hypothetical protein
MNANISIIHADTYKYIIKLKVAISFGLAHPVLEVTVDCDSEKQLTGLRPLNNPYYLTRNVLDCTLCTKLRSDLASSKERSKPWVRPI